MTVMAALVRHPWDSGLVWQTIIFLNRKSVNVGPEGDSLRMCIAENRHQTVAPDMLMQDGWMQFAQESRNGIMCVLFMSGKFRMRVQTVPESDYILNHGRSIGACKEDTLV